MRPGGGLRSLGKVQGMVVGGCGGGGGGSGESISLKDYGPNGPAGRALHLRFTIAPGLSSGH